MLPRDDWIFAAANFQLVAVGIFEKARVITTAVTVTEFRAFEIFGADFAQESCESINFFAALGPKSDSRTVGLVPPILREAEKCFRFVTAGSVENSPSSA